MSLFGSVDGDGRGDGGGAGAQASSSSSSAIALPKARALFETARRTRQLHLSARGLREVPGGVFNAQSGLTSCLVRLDLSYNRLVAVPPLVGTLTSLEQLWLNDNPFLVGLPAELEGCRRLRVLDLRRTGVRQLPRELGRLKQLMEVDLRDTPLATAMGPSSSSSSDQHVLDTEALLEALALVDQREVLRLDMLDRVETGVYREAASSDLGRHLIPSFVQAVCDAFEDCGELRNVARNCDRLFPPFEHVARHCAAAGGGHPFKGGGQGGGQGGRVNPRALERAAQKLRGKFVALVRETAKVKLSAELELKLRALYYDRIDPSKVEATIHSIYQGDWKVEPPLELEDITFLIQNATRIFPADPGAITGQGVRAAVWALQNALIMERQAVVDKLCVALTNSLYPDREPKQVAELAQQVGRLFERDRFATKKELEEMKKLAADASQHFPAEFSAAVRDPSAVKASVKRAAAASMSL